MNPKIEQFAELADLYADEKTAMPGEYHPDWHSIRDNHFARLIVETCTDIIATYAMSAFDRDDVHWCCENLIDEINSTFMECQ